MTTAAPNSPTKEYDLVCIDEPFIDLYYFGKPAAVNSKTANKGDSIRIESSDIPVIIHNLSLAAQHAGGSAANTAVALSRMGGKACFIAAIANSPDEQGYRNELTDDGIEVVSLPTGKADALGRCLIFIDPDDGERTMATVLPEPDAFHATDIPQQVLQQCKIVFTNGYCWNSTRSEVLKKAFQTVREHGGKTAFSLGSSKRVADCREEFQDLIKNHVDILFANAEELSALYPDKKPDEISHDLREQSEEGKVFIVTQKDKGAVIFAQGKAHSVPAHKNISVTNACGAGDAFAGGVLYGLTHDLTYVQAGLVGSHLASRVITRDAPRVQAEDVPASPKLTIATPVSRVSILSSNADHTPD